MTTSATTNRFSPVGGERAVRLVRGHAGDHPTRGAAVVSIAAEIGCAAQTLHGGTNKAEVDGGKRAGVPSEAAEKLRAGAREPRAAAGRRDPAPGVGWFCPGGARPPPLGFATILRSAGTLCFASPVQAMLAFIDEPCEAHGVEPTCKVPAGRPVPLARAWGRRADPSCLPAHAPREAELQGETRRVFEESLPHLWRAPGVAPVAAGGIPAARCTGARLMGDKGLAGVIRGKPVQTAGSDKAAPCPLDRVNRRFRVPAPTGPGFVYVAFVVDVPARRLVGGRVSRSAPAGFALDAREPALHEQRPVGGPLVHASDRGATCLHEAFA